MALIVEDGTGKVDAESYCSTLYATQYLRNRGKSTEWEALDVSVKEQYLRLATDFMVGKYRSKWKGNRTHFTQSLDWPRIGVLLENDYYPSAVIAYDLIPNDIKSACAELALRAMNGPLLEDQEMRVIQETVGPITTKFDPNSPAVIRYSQVDAMLGAYLGSGGSSAMVKLFRV